MRRTNGGKKISEFLEEGTPTSGAYWTFIESGVNYKIAQADVIAMLGATGTITPLGPVTGTDVLNVNGTVNEIRNISGGAAIAVSLNPDDGIDIDFSIDVDATGAPLMLNPTAATPTIVSLVAGNGVTITSVGDTVEIEAAEPYLINYGLVAMQGNATATTFVDTSTAAVVAGTFTAVNEENFLATTGGRLTYLGSTTRVFPVTANVSGHPTSGNNKLMYLYVAKNGSVIATSKTEADFSNAVEKQFCTITFVSLAQNDYLEIYIRNTTDTTSFTAVDAILRVG